MLCRADASAAALLVELLSGALPRARALPGGVEAVLRVLLDCLTRTRSCKGGGGGGGSGGDGGEGGEGGEGGAEAAVPSARSSRAPARAASARSASIFACERPGSQA